MYATSGLPGIDLIVGDREVVRESEECEYTERVVCLPGSYLTFEVGHRTPPIGPPPCASSRQFTFGSLVAQYKITHVVLDAWAEILRQADSSRLLLANRALRSTCNREYVERQFADRGIAGERLVFFGPAEHYEYLGYYNQIDLALDAFPYNGGTTTMEAIWQGVPVLTFDGDRWASRTSQTLLRRTHLTDFVAAGPREYVETAVAIASDPQAPSRLAKLRAEMRERLSASPACDVAGLARAMEQVIGQAVRSGV
jgi:predicted O-linked N-acetylglucosamine transferase (SPINDLY family)